MSGAGSRFGALCPPLSEDRMLIALWLATPS